jgi:hypothetical protein
LSKNQQWQKKILFSVSFVISLFHLHAQQPAALLTAKRYLGIAINNIKISSSGSVFSGGTYRNGNDFDPSSTVISLPVNSPNNFEAFLQKSDAIGNFLWAKSIVGLV